jgi:hypothetical protein
MRYHPAIMTGKVARTRKFAAAGRGLDQLEDAELLRLRFRDLGLSLDNSVIESDVHALWRELERRGIRFRPHVWLSTEWFSPDGIPGIAVPFFVAHPRLARLERRMSGDVEGGSRRWRQRILRHEAGHALDTAYGLRRRADWRAVFGRASKPYPRHYAVRPGSRRFVLHLGHWYAQSHPTEDFAETFAVWLQPKSRWRREYAGWPALEKLEYVDRLMREIGHLRPRRRDRSQIAPLSSNSRTLKEHYKRKESGDDRAERRYDPWLRRALRPRGADAPPAGPYLRELAPMLRRALSRNTDAGPYLIDHVIETVRRRARLLDLAIAGSRRDARHDILRLHERIVADVLRRNREQYVL